MTTNAARAPSSKNQHEVDSVGSARMSFGDHLDELRSCLIRALIGVALATALALMFGTTVLDIVFRPLLIVQHANGLQPRLQALGPTDAFAAYMRISFLTGFIVSMPWVLRQAWQFVASGLYPHERRFVRMLTWASSGLFAIGVVFLYFVVLPIVLQFFVSFNRSFEVSGLMPSAFQRLLLQIPTPKEAPTEGADPLQVPVLREDPRDGKTGLWINAATRRLVVRTPEGLWSAPLEPDAVSPTVYSEFAIDFYISFVLQLALAFGIAFETPLVVCFIAWIGIVSSATMIRSRRYIIFGIVVIAAVITPPDVMSQLLLAVPMYLLFELGLQIARVAERTKRKSANPTS
jgi:sec-independent protein translocase protein TatC